MQKVAVTGAAGFIGYHVTKRLIDEGYNVVAIDSLSKTLYSSREKRSRWEKLSRLPACTLYEANLIDLDFSSLLRDIDRVIHLAAVPGLDKSWTKFEDYVESNILATQALLEGVKNSEISKFLIISTSSVYGQTARNRSQTLRPISPYGVTKLAAENLALAYHSQLSLPVSVLRYFSVFGPEQRPDMAFRKFIDSALRDESIEIFGDGTQTRSNTYVHDVARWTIRALSMAKNGETYDLSGGTRRSLNEVIQEIEALTGKTLKKNFTNSSAGDQKHTGVSSKLAKDHGILDWETDFSEGLMAQVAWQQSLLDHE